MSSFNVVTGGRTQVLVDEQQLQQVQAEMNRRGIELERLKAAMETLSAVNGPAHFMAAAMALCNELASRWNAERVGVGFLRGRYVRLKALSHTEKITRNMQLVLDIESAMEECLDQNVEVIYPAPKDASFVYRSTETLASREAATAVCSFPLRRGSTSKEARQLEGDVVAVLLVERKGDKPFKLEEIETLRLTCDLFTARLADLYEHDRWVGAKAARSLRRGLAWGLGAKHTWAKVAAIAVAGFLAFVILVDGSYNVDAPFEIKADQEQIVSAPMAGIIEKVYADKGDIVFTPETAAHFDALHEASPLVDLMPLKRPPSVLVTFKTDKLKGELLESLGKITELQLRIKATRVNPDNRNGSNEAEADIIEAQLEQEWARLNLIRLRIDDASVKTQLDGIVFSGELKRKLGAPVNEGDELFRIGQLDRLFAELLVPEDQVMELKVGQHGELRATSLPGQSIRFTVQSIPPLAEAANTKNVFKVRVALNPEDVKPWMLPGVEGLAKVEVGKAPYGWLWSHKMMDWVRMKLWQWF